MDVFLKANKDRYGWELKFTMNEIEMKSWTCFGRDKSKNSDSIICITISSHLPSIVNNTSSSLIVMEPWKNLIFEPLILNDKHYNEHHPLEKWWHPLHDNFFHIFWNGGVAKLSMNNTPIIWNKRQHVKTKR